MPSSRIKETAAEISKLWVQLKGFFILVMCVGTSVTTIELT